MTSTPSPLIEIRPLLPSELAAIVGITRQVAFGAPWSQPKLETELAEAKSLGLFIQSQAGAGSAEVLAAFVFYRDLGEVLEISWLATEPRCQGQGLMSKLLQFLATASSGAQEIWLEVHESNGKARNLYEKIGFQVTSRRPQYYADGGGALLMSWRLT